MTELRKQREWRVRFEFKKHDAWIGAYWRRLISIGIEMDPTFPIVDDGRGGYQVTNFDLWVCIVPCFPIHIQWWRPL